MTLTSLIPTLAAVLLVVAMLVIALRPADRPADWRIPAALSVAFLAFSTVVILLEGPIGFWANHTQDLWGNQVWIDLLIGIGIGYGFAVPRAKAVGMNPLPWIVVILLTGCIGLLAMVARVLFLEARSPAPNLA